MLGIIGVALAPTLLRVMGGSPAVIANASFMRVMLGGNATVLLLFLINAVFRGAGDAAIAMRVLWLANWINIVLGPVAASSGSGRSRSSASWARRWRPTLGAERARCTRSADCSARAGESSVARRHFRLDPALMWQMVRLSGSGTFQILIGTASWIGLVRVISSFGSAALAGYTIGIRVIIFALLPSWGLSNAAATMVGQALGAKKPERAERAVWMAARYNFVFLGAVGLVFVLLARAIVSLFTDDPAVGLVRGGLPAHRRARASCSTPTGW